MRLSFPAALIAAIMILTGVAPGRGLAVGSGQLSTVSTTSTADSLDSPKAYFDRARKLGFPAAGQATPYLLRAEFTTRASSGTVMTGTYTDTWVGEKQWRREAVLGESRFVRSRHGKKWYRTDDGPDATLLQFVLTAMEPIPDTNDGHLDKWKLQRDVVDGTAVTKIWHGKQNADGTPDPKDFEGYWFDAKGQLIESYLNGLDIKRDKFADFNGVEVARQLQVMLAGKVGMKIEVTDLQAARTVDSKIFTMKGNDWRREYTSEVR
jgi:hypothetical protein